MEELKNKLVNLQKEFNELASLYDLHIIEVINIFHASLLEAYNYSFETFLVELNIKNQIIFYNTLEKKEVIYNFSKQKFGSIYKIFNKKLQIKSDSNLLSSFYSALSNTEYLELKIFKRTRNYVYLMPVHNNRINKNINFKFKIASKIHELYTKQHDTFWIKLSISNIDKIKYQNILKEKILLECNLIDYKINKKLIEHFFSKIFTKSNEKIGLSIKFYNPKSNTIHVTCNSFIPKLFINYIEQYILTNTTYKVNFLKK